MQMNLTLMATTIMGFESVLAQEIKALGLSDVTVSDTKVEFSGDLEAVCKSNLWLRTAGKVYIKLSDFEATTFDDLFDQTFALDWAKWIGPRDCFPVAQVSSRKSVLFSKSKIQAIVKKAVVEKLKKSHRVTTLPEDNALVAIRVQVEKDQVVLSIDTSGEGLHKRGYRAHMDKAPLRETLAAGLVLLSRWRPDRDVLCDPLCGSGTILIEAGLIAQNIAPGLHRSFAAEEWEIFKDSEAWEVARQDAESKITPDVKPQIFGSDKSDYSISIALKNAELAGVDFIHFETKPVQSLTSLSPKGKIITNPPYGERLEEADAAQELYEEMGDVFRTEFPDWSYYILTSHDNFERYFGQRATKNRKLFNGGIQCRYFQYWGS